MKNLNVNLIKPKNIQNQIVYDSIRIVSTYYPSQSKFYILNNKSINL